VLDRPQRARGSLAIVVKGYPRLSETFIAQEIAGLERLGFPVEIWSLRHPTDGAVHAMHRQIHAKARYLPEYLYQEPLRVLRGLGAALGRAAFSRLLRLFLRDLARDFTPNRGRRLGQALVLARELDPAIRHIHVHYLHTPCSVARYAALLTGRSFSLSAHAKDIWTTGDWEKREKLADAAFAVTCTAVGGAELHRVASPARRDSIEIVYHGLDLSRFPPPPEREPRDGRDPQHPVHIVSVGRAVAKKGYDDLLDALARLPQELNWRFTHIGSGELLKALKDKARALGIDRRIEWRGGQPQSVVIETLRSAHVFALACKEGAHGDRDGLPNVILEAATQALPVVSTRFGGVPEFVTDGSEGRLVAPGDAAALAAAIETLIRDPAERDRLGRAACRRVTTAFSFEAGLQAIADRLDAAMALAEAR
jgi:glycosyltransferase involved in cell wall biosynthesis